MSVGLIKKKSVCKHSFRCSSTSAARGKKIPEDNQRTQTKQRKFSARSLLTNRTNNRAASLVWTDPNFFADILPPSLPPSSSRAIIGLIGRVISLKVDGTRDALTTYHDVSVWEK